MSRNMETSTKKGNIFVAEFKSVSRGIMVTDSMVKSAEVNIVQAGSLCPGKYLTILEGEISALISAGKIAGEQGGRHLFSSFTVSGIDQRIIEAIGGDLAETPDDAIGIIEGPHMADLINSSDIAVDSAAVDFIEYRLARGCGVNSFFIITGVLSAVNEAADNASRFLGERGSLIAYRILPAPDRQVMRWMKSSLCKC
ncbi:MAG: BMC domain-containing protein [Candidatus Humimicrobiaceae bacterium]